MTQFPTYASHDEAYCFNCGGDWRGCATPMHSGYPSGQWFQTCEKCGHRTFYDLAEESDDESRV